MSKRDGKHLRQRTTLFVLAALSPLLFAECSLILNDLPEPVDTAPNSSAGGSAGETSTNQGGKSGSGGLGSGAGAENSGGVITAGGAVGAGGMPAPVAGATSEGGNNATGGSSGDSSADGGTGGSGCPCDCDKDGALNDEPGCHAGGGPADCDDSDADAKPDQPDFFEDERNIGGYDYDCDTLTEREEPQTLGTCPGLMLGACSPEQGFLAPLPACGDEGQWATCVKTQSGLGCEPSNLETRVMACH